MSFNPLAGVSCNIYDLSIVNYFGRFNPLAGVSCNRMVSGTSYAVLFQSPRGCELQPQHFVCG